MKNRKSYSHLFCRINRFCMSLIKFEILKSGIQNTVNAIANNSCVC